MKILFYSGGSAKDNFHLNQLAVELTGKKSPKVSLIPSAHFDADVDFKFFIQEFSLHKVSRFQCFTLDTPIKSVFVKELFLSDLIFFGGGNTFYFLKHLRESGLIPEFKNFLKNGGVLCGLSAGAILMTSHVHTASFPAFDRDDDPYQTKNLKAMGLVDFEFFPHYKNSQRYSKEMLEYSLKNSKPLYAVCDGSGILVLDREIRFIGDVFQFYRGEKLAY